MKNGKTLTKSTFGALSSELWTRYLSLIIFTRFVLSIVALCLSPSFAATRSGSTGAQFLNLGVSARSIAMGNAYTAVSYGGAIAANYNPAGLYGTDRPEVSFMHYQYILNSNFSYLGYAHPLGKSKRVILGGNVIYGTYGSIEETRVNVGADSGLKTGQTFTANDSAGTLTLMALPMERLGVGLNLKYVKQEIAGSVAGVPASDIGVLYRMGPKLSLGFTVRNIGPDLKFDKETAPLPLSYTFGVTYALLKNQMLIFSSDFEKPRNQGLAVRFGGELNIGSSWNARNSRIPQFSLRAGHDGFVEAGTGLSMGGGLRIDNYSMDYAFIPFGQLGQAHRISATVRFGKIIPPAKLQKKKTTR